MGQKPPTPPYVVEEWPLCGGVLLTSGAERAVLVDQREVPKRFVVGQPEALHGERKGFGNANPCRPGTGYHDALITEGTGRVMPN